MNFVRNFLNKKKKKINFRPHKPQESEKSKTPTATAIPTPNIKSNKHIPKSSISANQTTSTPGRLRDEKNKEKYPQTQTTMSSTQPIMSLSDRPFDRERGRSRSSQRNEHW